jgi:hypothetical protein
MPKPWTAPEYEILDRESGRGAARRAGPAAASLDVCDPDDGVLARHRVRRPGPWSAEETATVLANYPSKGAKRTAALPQDVAAHANMHCVYRIWEAA